MLLQNNKTIYYGVGIFFIIVLIIAFYILRPIQSYRCYKMLTTNKEIASIMDGYIYLAIEYYNITLTYPSENDLQAYYSKYHLFEEDFSKYDVFVKHYLSDSTFTICISCRNLHTMNCRAKTKKQTYWSFLVNKTITWQSLKLDSKTLCFPNHRITLLKSGKPVGDIEHRKVFYKLLSNFLVVRLNYYAYCHYRVNSESIEVLCDNGIVPYNIDIIKQSLKSILDEKLSKYDIDEIYFFIN